MIGVAYKPACKNTSQIGPISLKRTKSVDKMKDTPVASKTNSIKSGTKIKLDHENWTPLIKAKTKTTIKLWEN